ncbi:MAG TPA: hypothetical protein VMA55_21970 [Acidovorax sp.]|nr:hypothetical protein [Acidovorax sp.]
MTNDSSLKLTLLPQAIKAAALVLLGVTIFCIGFLMGCLRAAVGRSLPLIAPTAPLTLANAVWSRIKTRSGLSTPDSSHTELRA